MNNFKSPANSDLQEIGRYHDLKHAELIKSVLNSENIAAMVPDAHTAAILPHVMLNPSGGVRVLVPKKDLDQAQKILVAFEQAKFDFPESPNEAELPLVPKDRAQRLFEASLLCLVLPVVANLWVPILLITMIKHEPHRLISVKSGVGIVIWLLTTTAWLWLVFN